MDKKRRCSFLVMSNETSSKRRVLRLNGLTVFVLGSIALALVAGFTRAVYFFCSYTYAHYGLYVEMRHNKQLQNKVAFLKKFSEESQEKINMLISFEDMARLKFGMTPISEDIRLAGIGGKPSVQQILSEVFDEPCLQRVTGIDNTIDKSLRQLKIQETTFNRMYLLIQKKHEYWSQQPSIWPTIGRVSSQFGYRYHPLLHERLFHEGIDISNHLWSPVVATADGLVSFVGLRGNYGNSVMITHRMSGYVTVFAHLAQASVVNGQRVKRGDVIGYIGNSGRSTGPHLHYEIRQYNRMVDPLSFILPSETVVD